MTAPRACMTSAILCGASSAASVVTVSVSVNGDASFGLATAAGMALGVTVIVVAAADRDRRRKGRRVAREHVRRARAQAERQARDVELLVADVRDGERVRGARRAAVDETAGVVRVGAEGERGRRDADLALRAGARRAGWATAGPCRVRPWSRARWSQGRRWGSWAWKVTPTAGDTLPLGPRFETSVGAIRHTRWPRCPRASKETVRGWRSGVGVVRDGERLRDGRRVDRELPEAQARDGQESWSPRGLSLSETT